jgi:hypothetical protein
VIGEKAMATKEKGRNLMVLQDHLLIYTGKILIKYLVKKKKLYMKNLWKVMKKKERIRE